MPSIPPLPLEPNEARYRKLVILSEAKDPLLLSREKAIE
jgi:hypothetical protein